MIEPTNADAGKGVIYGGTLFAKAPGVIVGVSPFDVYVSFGDDPRGFACKREELTWDEGKQTRRPK